MNAKRERYLKLKKKDYGRIADMIKWVMERTGEEPETVAEVREQDIGKLVVDRLRREVVAQSKGVLTIYRRQLSRKEMELITEGYVK